MGPLDRRKERAKIWFESLRDRITAAFEELETPCRRTRR